MTRPQHVSIGLFLQWVGWVFISRVESRKVAFHQQRFYGFRVSRVRNVNCGNVGL